MARIARVVLPGVPHHVTQRGVRSMPVFHSDEDRLIYLALLKAQAERFGLSVLSYCLMDNHVHLVVVPLTADSLARAIGEAHRRYTCRANATQGVKGYLFQGRFYSCPLDDRHLVAAAIYAERNPVRAGLVKRPWDYRWSSARFHIGAKDADPLVDDIDILGLAAEWRELLASDPDELAALRKHTRTGRPCGDEAFIRKAEKLTRRDLRIHPSGRRPGSANRKRD